MKWVARFAGDDDRETWSVELTETPEQAAVEFIRPLAKDGSICDGDSVVVKVRPLADASAPWQRIRVTSTWQYAATKENPAVTTQDIMSGYRRWLVQHSIRMCDDLIVAAQEIGPAASRVYRECVALRDALTALAAEQEPAPVVLGPGLIDPCDSEGGAP